MCGVKGTSHHQFTLHRPTEYHLNNVNEVLLIVKAANEFCVVRSAEEEHQKTKYPYSFNQLDNHVEFQAQTIVKYIMTFIWILDEKIMFVYSG